MRLSKFPSIRPSRIGLKKRKCWSQIALVPMGEKHLSVSRFGAKIVFCSHRLQCCSRTTIVGCYLKTATRCSNVCEFWDTHDSYKLTAALNIRCIYVVLQSCSVSGEILTPTTPPPPPPGSAPAEDAFYLYTEFAGLEIPVDLCITIHVTKNFRIFVLNTVTHRI